MNGKIVLEGKSEDGKIVFSVEIPAPKLNAEEEALVKYDLENAVLMFLCVLTGINFTGGLAGAGLGMLNNSIKNVAESMEKQIELKEQEKIVFH